MSDYHKQYYLKNKNKLNQAARQKYEALKQNPEAYQKHLDKGKQWRKENLEHDMWFQARKRALEKGLDFDLEVSDIVIPDVCPILGIKLERLDKRHDGSPSLDRIDNKKGYVKGNVDVISWRANAIKKDATDEELLKIAWYVANKLNTYKDKSDG